MTHTTPLEQKLAPVCKVRGMEPEAQVLSRTHQPVVAAEALHRMHVPGRPFSAHTLDVTAPQRSAA